MPVNNYDKQLSELQNELIDTINNYASVLPEDIINSFKFDIFDMFEGYI